MIIFHKINELNKSIHNEKAEKSEIDYRIRSIREADTFEHSIIDGKYSGTAAKIALKLKKESVEFDWLRDKIDYNQELPFPPSDLIKMHTELRSFTPELTAELELSLPDPDQDLPSQKVLEGLVNQYFETKARFSSTERLVKTSLGNKLMLADKHAIHNIIENVSKLTAAVASIRKRPMLWIEEAVYDM